jgi:hypothetical protein
VGRVEFEAELAALMAHHEALAELMGEVAAHSQSEADTEAMIDARIALTRSKADARSGEPSSSASDK